MNGYFSQKQFDLRQRLKAFASPPAGPFDDDEDDLSFAPALVYRSVSGDDILVTMVDSTGDPSTYCNWDDLVFVDKVNDINSFIREFKDNEDLKLRHSPKRFT